MSDKQWNSPPPMTIDPKKNYTATMETSKGTIEIELFAKDAPKTVNNLSLIHICPRCEKVPPTPRPCFHNDSMRSSKTRVSCIQ